MIEFMYVLFNFDTGVPVDLVYDSNNETAVGLAEGIIDDCAKGRHAAVLCYDDYPVGVGPDLDSDAGYNWHARVVERFTNLSTYKPRHRKDFVRVWQIAQILGYPSSIVRDDLIRFGLIRVGVAGVKSASSRVPSEWAERYITDEKSHWESR
jgi:hypothetical protein